jgi:hypothetical protein
VRKDVGIREDIDDVKYTDQTIMPRKETSINPLAKTLSDLTNKLEAVKGGRLILAFATGAMNVIPIVSGVGSGILEYRNIYASAAVNDRIAALAANIDEVSKALNDQTERLNTLFEMIEQISSRLKDYMDPIAFSKVDDMDVIAGSLLKPSVPECPQDFAASNQLDILLEERSFKNILLRLDDLPQLPVARSRLVRTKALYGLSKFEDIYVLLKKEPISALSQEELEDYIWSCFQLGYNVDATVALQHHEHNFNSSASQLFRSAVKTRFLRGTVPLWSANGIERGAFSPSLKTLSSHA